MSPPFPARPSLPRGISALAALVGLLIGIGCGGRTLDAGGNERTGQLPVDVHNPVILDNDSSDNDWAGEFAMLLANTGGPALVGIIVDASSYWPDQDANVSGWNGLVDAARKSGLKHLPDVTRGASTTLTAPSDRRIEATDPLRSDGARLILDLSQRYSLPGQPLVVVTGAQLTNLADAYLMDPTIVDRVTVVAMLGSYSAQKARMTGPNGDLDPWADWIVAQKFQYVQLVVLHDETADVTEADVSTLPKNPLGERMASKRSNISTYTNAADHLAVLAVSVPSFVTAIEHCVADTSAGFNSPPGQGPPLACAASGGDTTNSVTVVTQVDESLVRTQLWRMLQTPGLFPP